MLSRTTIQLDQSFAQLQLQSFRTKMRRKSFAALMCGNLPAAAKYYPRRC